MVRALHDPMALRAAGLIVPLALTGALWWWRRPDGRGAAAASLATVWNLVTLLPVCLLASRRGWFWFDADAGVLLGMPVDLWLGWALLWGAIPSLALSRAPVVVIAVGAFWFDLLAMPALEPVVGLGNDWLPGELVAIAVSLVPALLLAGWTSRGQHLEVRAAVQVLLAGGLVLGVAPAVVLQATGGGWRPLLARPAWQTALALWLLVVPAVLGLAAVQEFVTRGRGTPMPCDPPRRLVTTGPYAYVSNPMQLSLVLLFLGWAVLLASREVAAAGLVVAMAGACTTEWYERRQLEAEHGAAWRAYRRAVRCWLPRWRPYTGQGGPVARLEVAGSGGPCGGAGAWFARRHPAGLLVVPSRRSSGGSHHRTTYAAADGERWSGVAAVARGLEHLHLGWALLGWLLRLPLLAASVQLLIDMFSTGSRRLGRRPTSVN